MAYEYFYLTHAIDKRIYQQPSTEERTAFSYRYQRVRITLHAVINGNYHTSRSNRQEFEQAQATLVAGH